MYVCICMCTIIMYCIIIHTWYIHTCHVYHTCSMHELYHVPRTTSCKEVKLHYMYACTCTYCRPWKVCIFAYTRNIHSTYIVHTYMYVCTHTCVHVPCMYAGRYRIQGNSYDTLWLTVAELVLRLRAHFGAQSTDNSLISCADSMYILT